MRTIRKALALLLAVLLLTSAFVIAPQAATTVKNQSLSIKAECLYGEAFEVLKQVNALRKAQGLSELKMNKVFLDNAMQRAAEIAVDFGHTRPDGSVCFTVNENNDIRAENIGYAYKNATDVVKGWKESKQHNANMMRSDLKSIGIGAVEHNGRRYWVQEFGTLTSDIVTDAPADTTKAFNIELGSNTFNLDFSMPDKMFLTDVKEIQVVGKNRTKEAYFVVNSDSLTYSSSDFSVISMDKSVATVLKKGSTTLTAKNSAVTVSKKITVDSFGASASKKCGDNITWEYNNGTLRFVGSGDMYDYKTTYDIEGVMTGTNLPYKDGFNYVEKVIIDEGITSVSDSAFTFFEKLRKVELPSTLQSIGDNAFAFCLSLESVDIPDSVTTIGKEAFRKCLTLESIDLPEKLESVPAGMLYSCTGIKEVSIPATVTSIGKSAFAYCSELTAISLPKKLQSIGLLAFISCEKIKEVSIPYSVTQIDDKAFMDCKALSKVTVNNPATVFEDVNIFSGTPSGLIVYGYDKSSTQKYCTQNKLTFKAIGGEDLSVTAKGYTVTYDALPMSKDIELNVEPDIDYQVRYSKGTSFDYNTNFSSVSELSKYYREDIDYDKRVNGYLLDSGTYPVSYCVTSSGFEPVTGYVNIVIDKAQPKFYFEKDSAQMFFYKGGDNSKGFLNVLVDRGSIEDIDLKFATNDTQLVALDWHGKAVAKNYGECTVTATFDGNKNYYPHSASYKLKINPVGKIKIAEYTYEFFEDMTASVSLYQGSFDNVTVPAKILDYKIETVGEQAFYSRGFTTLIVPQGIKKISDKAFLSSYLLSELELSNTITYIGDYAFAGCKLLSSVTVPISVTHIGEKAFGYTAPDANGESKKIDGFVIYGYKGSVAESYALEHGFEFSELEIIVPDYIVGDVDGDGVVSVMDATEIQMVLALMKQWSGEKSELAADVDGDGVASVMDATEIQMVKAGLK